MCEHKHPRESDSTYCRYDIERSHWDRWFDEIRFIRIEREWTVLPCVDVLRGVTVIASGSKDSRFTAQSASRLSLTIQLFSMEARGNTPPNPETTSRPNPSSSLCYTQSYQSCPEKVTILVETTQEAVLLRRQFFVDCEISHWHFFVCHPHVQIFWCWSGDYIEFHVQIVNPAYSWIQARKSPNTIVCATQSHIVFKRLWITHNHVSGTFSSTSQDMICDILRGQLSHYYKASSIDAHTAPIHISGWIFDD